MDSGSLLGLCLVEFQTALTFTSRVSHVLYVHFIKKKETTLDFFFFWVPFPLPAVFSVFSGIFGSRIRRDEGEGWGLVGDVLCVPAFLGGVEMWECVSLSLH